MMTKRQWKILIGINLLTALLVLLPFLPGPSFLSGLTNPLFSVLQLLGIFGLLAAPIGIFWTLAQVLKGKHEKIKLISILIWTIPVVLFTHSFWIADILRDFSRNLAISNADNMITAIETYKIDNTQYPNSLENLLPNYLKRIPSPWIMGISRYNYKKQDDNFNLAFSQNVIIGFNFEVVVYDPTENHKAEGELKALYETGKDKWKYYIYD
jgi:hypothetical protein